MSRSRVEGGKRSGAGVASLHYRRRREMAYPIKSVLTVIAGAALVAGCATGAYYQDYGYGYGPGYDYDGYGPTYYGAPGYVAPSLGFGITYIDRDDDRRQWRDDRRRDWR